MNVSRCESFFTIRYFRSRFSNDYIQFGAHVHSDVNDHPSSKSLGRLGLPWGGSYRKISKFSLLRLGRFHYAIWRAHRDLSRFEWKKSPITSLSSERKRKPRRTFMYLFLQNNWSESIGTNVELQRDNGTTIGAYGIRNTNFICAYKKISNSRRQKSRTSYQRLAPNLDDGTEFEQISYARVVVPVLPCNSTFVPNYSLQ